MDVCGSPSSFLRIGAVALLALAPGACSLFTSFDGLAGTNGETPPGAADAGGDAPSVETSLPEGGAPDDDGGTTAFCASLAQAPALCEDFDSADPLAPWTVTEVGDGSTVTTSTTTTRSRPRALRAAIGTGRETRRAYVDRTLPGNVTHARFGYSLYIDERPMTGEIEVNILRYLAPTNARDFFLAITPTGAHHVQQEGAQKSVLPLTVPVPTRQWVRIEIEMVLAGNKFFNVYVDGAKAAEGPVLYGVPAPPRISAGITYTDSQPERGTIFVDDVVYEVLQ